MMRAIAFAGAILAAILVLSAPSRAASLVARVNVSTQTMEVIRYGKVFVPDSGTNATFANVNAGTYVPIDQWLAAETIVDLEGRFSFTDNIRLAIGAENVFDEYPDPVPISLNSTGNLPYSNYGPFGRAGRYVYGRLVVDF